MPFKGLFPRTYLFVETPGLHFGAKESVCLELLLDHQFTRWNMPRIKKIGVLAWAKSSLFCAHSVFLFPF
jgi:NAD(P)H-nitrite reductase large subunit